MTDQKLHAHADGDWLTDEECEALWQKREQEHIENARMSGRHGQAWNPSECQDLDVTDKWWVRGTAIALVCFWVGIIVLVRGCG